MHSRQAALSCPHIPAGPVKPLEFKAILPYLCLNTAWSLWGRGDLWGSAPWVMNTGHFVTWVTYHDTGGVHTLDDLRKRDGAGISGLPGCGPGIIASEVFGVHRAAEEVLLSVPPGNCL